MDELLPRKAKPHTSPDIGIFPLRYRHYTLWRNKALNWETVSEHQLFVWFFLWQQCMCLGSPPVQLRFTLNLSSVLSAICRGEVKCSNMHFAIVAIPEDKNSNKQYRLFTIEHLMLQLLHTKANAQTWFQVSNPRTCLDSRNVICDLHRNSGSNMQLFQWLDTYTLHRTTPFQVSNPPSHEL